MSNRDKSNRRALILDEIEAAERLRTQDAARYESILCICKCQMKENG